MWKFRVPVLVALLLGSAAGASDTAVPAVPARSKVNLPSLISNEDYPASAQAAQEQGPVEFTLDVGPDGRVTGCVVTLSSGSPALDSTTCRLMRSRARFTPALDDAGATVADRMTGRIIWRL
jgi:protein TonB